MNKLIISSVFALVTLIFVSSSPLKAQEKKVHIKKVKMENGEKVEIDTVFTVKDGENEKDVIKKITWVSDNDSTNEYTFDVEVDADAGKKEVIVIKSGDDNAFFMDGDEDHDIKIIKHGGDHSGHQVFVFKNADGDEEHIQKLILKSVKDVDSLEELHLELETKMIIMEDELEALHELKSLKNMEDLEKLKELKIIAELEEIKELKEIEMVMPELHHSGNAFWVDSRNHHSKVTESELRDAGISVKSNRLKLESYNINIDNDVVEVDFTILGDASPKVTVYNYYGEKITTLKPEVYNNKYSFKVDLSQKQRGTYYIHIVNRDSSITKKVVI